MRAITSCRSTKSEITCQSQTTLVAGKYHRVANRAAEQAVCLSVIYFLVSKILNQAAALRLHCESVAASIDHFEDLTVASRIH